MRKTIIIITFIAIIFSGCGVKDDKTEIQVFIAASLNSAMTELAQEYNKTHPDIKITYNADSSGKLLTQIEEGYECDIFFSAAQKQMDKLIDDGLAVDGTVKNVLKNHLVVVALKDSDTNVTGLSDLNRADSIALADESVPAGKYTRNALVKLGIINESQFGSDDISKALGGVEISEQGNVSKVLIAVAEGSCQVGTTYYSDIYGYEDKLRIIENVDTELTGDIVYPICMVKNKDADIKKQKAADEFMKYILSDESKKVFNKYYFDTEVN